MMGVFWMTDALVSSLPSPKLLEKRERPGFESCSFSDSLINLRVLTPHWSISSPIY